MTVLIGGILLVVGLVTSSFVNSFWPLLVTNGIISGQSSYNIIKSSSAALKWEIFRDIAGLLNDNQEPPEKE